VVKIGDGNTVRGTVREVRVEGAMAIVRIQFGENIMESVMPSAVAEEMGIKAGDPVTAMIESTPADIIR
jgi:molybdopterin-binding protein